MSLISQIGTAIGTATAYIVHYGAKSPTPVGIVGIVAIMYSNRGKIGNKIQDFAIKHALDKSSPNAIQDNLLECLQYID